MDSTKRCGDAETNLHVEKEKAVYVLLTAAEDDVCVEFTLEHGVSKKVLARPVKVCPLAQKDPPEKEQEQDKKATLLWLNDKDSMVDASLHAASVGHKSKAIQGRILLKKP